MANLTDYSEQRLINHVLRATTWTTLGTNVWIALFSNAQDATGDSNAEAGTLTEVTGGAYARQQATSWDAPGAGGTTSNSATITFPTATGAYTVSYVCVMDASTGGNAITWGRLSGGAQSVASGSQFRINVGDYDVTAA